MRKRAIICMVLAVLMLLPVNTAGGDSSAKKLEYQLKAAFLYNFAKFVQWPDEQRQSSDTPITISIIGKDPFKESFKPITARRKKGDRDLKLKYYEDCEALLDETKEESAVQIEEIKKSHIVFIADSEKHCFKKVVELVKGEGVLTVADTKGFLEEGGAINFIMVKGKVRFEVNLKATKESNLKMRSQILKLAKRVIKDD